MREETTIGTAYTKCWPCNGTGQVKVRGTNVDTLCTSCSGDGQIAYDTDDD